MRCAAHLGPCAHLNLTAPPLLAPDAHFHSQLPRTPQRSGRPSRSCRTATTSITTTTCMEVPREYGHRVHGYHHGGAAIRDDCLAGSGVVIYGEQLGWCADGSGRGCGDPSPQNSIGSTSPRGRQPPAYIFDLAAAFALNLQWPFAPDPAGDPFSSLLIFSLLFLY